MGETNTLARDSNEAPKQNRLRLKAELAQRALKEFIESPEPETPLIARFNDKDIELTPRSALLAAVRGQTGQIEVRREVSTVTEILMRNLHERQKECEDRGEDFPFEIVLFDTSARFYDHLRLREFREVGEELQGRVCTVPTAVFNSSSEQYKDSELVLPLNRIHNFMPLLLEPSGN